MLIKKHEAKYIKKVNKLDNTWIGYKDQRFLISPRKEKIIFSCAKRSATEFNVPPDDSSNRHIIEKVSVLRWIVKNI